MSNQIEKTVWATAEILDWFFNPDQSEDTVQYVVESGAEALKQYAYESAEWDSEKEMDYIEYDGDVTNLELVDWEVAHNLCCDWYKSGRPTTRTSAHVREYMGIED